MKVIDHISFSALCSLILCFCFCFLVFGFHVLTEEIEYLKNKFDINVYNASHPIPDDRGVQASKDIIKLIQQSSNKQRTLIITCISGGGSALFCIPHPTLTLEDIINVNKVLLECGMDITEMNMIRKCLDVGKGGRLATAAYPSTMITLVLSDVIGDPLDLIASGPTVPNDIRNEDEGKGEGEGEGERQLLWYEARRIVKEYNLNELLPTNVLNLIHGQHSSGNYGDDGQSPTDTIQNNKNNKEEEEMSAVSVSEEAEASDLEDFPSSYHPMFSTKRNTSSNSSSSSSSSSTKLSETFLIGNNHLALLEAAQKAKKLGYHPIILSTSIQGEAKTIASVYVSMAEYLQLQQKQQLGLKNEEEEGEENYKMTSSLPAAIIAGGETTVTLSSSTSSTSTSTSSSTYIGKGGRNQELGLAAALQLQTKQLRNIILASIGTDGTDGPTDAAGVMVDGNTIYRIEKEAEQSLDTATEAEANNTKSSTIYNSTSTTVTNDDNSSFVLTAKDALCNHDSYTFFQREKSSAAAAADDDDDLCLIKTGPTGTNVADIAIVLVQ